MSAVLGLTSSQKTGSSINSNSNMKKEVVEQKTDDKLIDTLLSCDLKEKSDTFCKDYYLMKEDADSAVFKHTDDNVSLNIDVQKDDKGDESLSNQKQQFIGNIKLPVDEKRKTEVAILSLSVLSPGRADVVLPIPFPNTTSKATLFTLKEGSKYRIKFLFNVTNHPVKNLTYTYMVWKAGLRVHQTKKLIGTFSPRQEKYTFELEEGTTPTGFFARGPFLVRSKFVDDDGNCYLDTTYYFDIRKDWGAREKC